jgi:hypothetical protein
MWYGAQGKDLWPLHASGGITPSNRFRIKHTLAHSCGILVIYHKPPIQINTFKKVYIYINLAIVSNMDIIMAPYLIHMWSKLALTVVYIYWIYIANKNASIKIGQQQVSSVSSVIDYFAWIPKGRARQCVVLRACARALYCGISDSRKL